MAIKNTSIIPKNRPPTSPGEFILKDWLEPMGMTQLALAAKLGVSMQRLNGIINGRRAVTAETAILLGRVLKTTPEFWLNAQAAMDLYHARQKLAAAARKVRAIESKARGRQAA
jgi:addiction module HigA family antidote